jgi:hypothetical protein
VSLHPAGTELRRRSPVRAAQERAYLRDSRLFLEGKVCAVRDDVTRCGGLSGLQVHHMAGRVGWRLLYMPWWVVLCPWHHDYIGGHRDEAMWRGLSLPLWAEPWMCLNHGYTNPSSTRPCRHIAEHDGLHSWEPEVDPS